MSHSLDCESSLAHLQTWFESVPAAAVALSGGVDSSLVAFLARRFLGAERVTAYLAVSPSLKAADRATAHRFCRRNEIVLKEIEPGEIDDPNYLSNPVNRCFFCKSSLYSAMVALLPRHRDTWILNGTNRDDLGDWRPGLLAADEFGARGPLAECGLDKTAVRALASHLGLECWDRPASPCLASRIPYGQRVTREKLRQIEFAEIALRQLGFPIARVRHFGAIARVEVPGDRLSELESCRDEIEARLNSVGFEAVEIDREGFVSGKLNRAVMA